MVELTVAWLSGLAELPLDAALDQLYDAVDEALLAGRFAEVDRLLAEAPAGRLSPDILLGLLVTTLPAKPHLENRPQFYARVRIRYAGLLRDPAVLLGLG